MLQTEFRKIGLDERLPHQHVKEVFVEDLSLPNGDFSLAKGRLNRIAYRPDELLEES